MPHFKQLLKTHTIMVEDEPVADSLKLCLMWKAGTCIHCVFLDLQSQRFVLFFNYPLR